jgi:glycosyltransferase involved in cell wall biosynthesis
VLSPGSFISQIKRVMGPDGVSLLWLNRRAHALIVCSHEERARLDSFFGAPVVRVIPHFVESRTMPPVTGQEAKQHCGLAGHRVVTLLGFIHPRKGHGMLLDALKHLPEDIVAVFAGAARDERIVNNLRALATDLGVSHRVRITGYLDEGTLGYYLAATDLAVCPFADVAASSSLATWISAARPVLASDLPLIAEYNRIETGAIGVFSPYSAPALAAAILSALKQPEMPVVAAIQRLRQQLEISSIIDRHRLLYEDVAQKNKGRRGTPN